MPTRPINSLTKSNKVYYRIEKFQLALNANNLLNKTHWVGGYDYNRLYPGAPRNLLASVGYTF